MIKQIRLVNFQAHKDTVLELHPGVNVIAGSSNSGKSSILRAFNWVKDNRPSGDAFVSHWARDAKGNQKDDTFVSIVDEKGTVERRKSKATGNTYTIDDTVLEAVGLDVPEEVSKALNLTEVNAQRQHDAPFLLNDSPGEVARFFNKIVHFDAIDAYLSALESKKRKTKAEKDTANQMIERLEKDLKQFEWLEEAEPLLDRIEEIETRLADLVAKQKTLSAGISAHEEASEKLPALTKLIKLASKTVSEIQEGMHSFAEIADKATKLRDTITRYAQHQKELEAAEVVGYAEKLVRKIDRQGPILADLKGQHRALVDDLSVHYTMRKELEKIEIDLPAAIAELPKTCPTCGKELDECATS